MGLTWRMLTGEVLPSAPFPVNTLGRSCLISTSADSEEIKREEQVAAEQALTKEDFTVNGSLQQLSATLLDLRCWPSPQAGSELAAYSADPPEGWPAAPTAQATGWVGTALRGLQLFFHRLFSWVGAVLGPCCCTGLLWLR